MLQQINNDSIKCKLNSNNSSRDRQMLLNKTTLELNSRNNKFVNNQELPVDKLIKKEVVTQSLESQALSLTLQPRNCKEFNDYILLTLFYI